MTTYRPPDKSLFQKLSENLFVQLSLVVLVGLIAVMMITKNQKQSFWTRVQFLRGSSSTQVAQSDGINYFSAPDQNEIASQDTSTLQVESTVVTGEKRLKAAQAPRAKIYYLEIPQTVLVRWLEEGILTRVETSEGVTIGYIPQLAQILDQHKDQIKVVKQESYPYNLNQLYTAKLDKPVEPAAATGRTVATTETQALTAYATLDDDRNDTLTGQLEVSVNPQSSFPAQFEMTPDQSFFISGFDKSQSANRAAASETVVVLKIDK